MNAENGMSGVQRPEELCIINNGELGCAPGSKQERADMCCAIRLRTEFEKGTTEKCPAAEGHAGNRAIERPSSKTLAFRIVCHQVSFVAIYPHILCGVSFGKIG